MPKQWPGGSVSRRGKQKVAKWLLLCALAQEKQDFPHLTCMIVQG